MKRLNTLTGRRTLTALTLCAALILTTACPVQWATRDDPTDTLLLYIDRVVGYTDSGIDIVKALVKEDKITPDTAQTYKDAFQRIHDTNKAIFAPMFPAGSGNQSLKVRLTQAARVQIERAILTLKSDVKALEPPPSPKQGVAERMAYFLTPLADAVQGLSGLLEKVKWGGGGGMTGDLVITLTPAQAARLQCVKDQLDDSTKDIAAWTN